jgi:hypothetical protein
VAHPRRTIGAWRGRLEELAADLAATPEAGPAVCPEHVADGSGGE